MLGYRELVAAEIPKAPAEVEETDVTGKINPPGSSVGGRTLILGKGKLGNFGDAPLSRGYPRNST
jgi:hypothetical protein